MTHQAPSLFDAKIVGPALGDAFKKLDPRLMIRNPVMFVTLVGALAILQRNLPSGFIRLDSQNATIAAQGVAQSTTACRAPSPLNGERAGVRGESMPDAEPVAGFEINSTL